jgi:hypothetical protein
MDDNDREETKLPEEQRRKREGAEVEMRMREERRGWG